MKNILIKGGVVVDGTGDKPYPADVRVRDGIISEIGQNISPIPNEKTVDASGCYVSPGFIESHTHLDGVMWWQQNLDPLPGYGVTTCIMGHCGFSAAPMSPDPEVRAEMIKIFSFFEDIPIAPFVDELPWDWEFWSDYKKSVTEKVKVPVNYGAFVGHINLRLVAMGLAAWDRPATAIEISRMAELLDDALANGAMGLSTNLMDQDGDNRPVPTLLASDDEFSALLDVMAKYPGACIQILSDIFTRMTGADSMVRLEGLCRGKNVRVHWVGMPTMQYQKDVGIQQQMYSLHEKFVRDGNDFWVAFSHTSLVTTLSVNHSMLWALANTYVWHEVVATEGADEKIALLSDPEWRQRARHSLDNDVIPFWPIADPKRLYLLNSENGVGPIKCTVADYAAQIGAHYSDAMADWFIKNGLKSTIHLAQPPLDEEMVVKMLRDPRSVANNNDVGAHSQMFCGGGENIILLTKYVRDQKLVSIEEAVHAMTGKLAKHFSIPNRGEIKVGMCADITVFDLNEIEYRDMEKIFDVPNGENEKGWRWTRDPAPVRLTLVNGVPSFESGASTGVRSGHLIGPRQR